MHFYIVIICFFIAYFLSCNYLDRLEEKSGSNAHSHLWLSWFAYGIRLQAIAFIVIESREITLAIENNNDISNASLMLVANLILFLSSFWILKRNKLAWFTGTIFSLNVIAWIYNSYYYLRNKDAFNEDSLKAS